MGKKKHWMEVLMNSNLKIKLTKEQQHLIKIIFNQKESLFIIKDEYLIADKKNKDTIINQINTYFNKNGLKNNYEPNLLGQKLENLLDLFLDK